MESLDTAVGEGDLQGRLFGRAAAPAAPGIVKTRDKSKLHLGASHRSLILPEEFCDVVLTDGKWLVDANLDSK